MGSPEVSSLLLQNIIHATDQKPLQAILSKSLVEATPQMQRLLLQTIPYVMTVEYIKGETTSLQTVCQEHP